MFLSWHNHQPKSLPATVGFFPYANHKAVKLDILHNVPDIYIYIICEQKLGKLMINQLKKGLVRESEGGAAAVGEGLL